MIVAVAPGHILSGTIKEAVASGGMYVSSPKVKFLIWQLVISLGHTLYKSYCNVVPSLHTQPHELLSKS